jgi:hypothetical protein
MSMLSARESCSTLIILAKAIDGGAPTQSHFRNRIDGGGTVPPICAALYNESDNIEIIQLLISAGADVNAFCT